MYLPAADAQFCHAYAKYTRAIAQCRRQKAEQEAEAVAFSAAVESGEMSEQQIAYLREASTGKIASPTSRTKNKMLLMKELEQLV